MTCMPVLELPGRLGWATQTSAILLQNGFSHFSIVTCSSPVTLTEGRAVCLAPTTNESASATKCLSLGLMWMFNERCLYLIRNTPTVTHVLWFNSVSSLICSGTALKLEISHSKWEYSGNVVGETLGNDRGLQNTSASAGWRSVRVLVCWDYKRFESPAAF